ncbi:hypothetical protein HN587_01895 [Candidatus Woesearchaeota archaeon]|nr:hypothetical protein [Candidatus Woesearchaeota archaeon]
MGLLNRDKTALLKGRVMGYLDKRYTTPIHPAEVYLKIHVKDEEHPDGRLFNPLLESDMNAMKEEFPDLYDMVSKHYKAFKPAPVKNQQGEFMIKNVPIGWWCYVVTARVEEKDYDLYDPMSNNGFDAHEEIKGPFLEEVQSVEGIIIAVEDEWSKKAMAPPKTDDPKTDPKTVPGGMPEESELLKRLKKKKGERELPPEKK